MVDGEKRAPTCARRSHFQATRRAKKAPRPSRQVAQKMTEQMARRHAAPTRSAQPAELDWLRPAVAEALARWLRPRPPALRQPAYPDRGSRELVAATASPSPSQTREPLARLSPASLRRRSCRPPLSDPPAPPDPPDPPALSCCLCELRWTGPPDLPEPTAARLKGSRSFLPDLPGLPAPAREDPARRLGRRALEPRHSLLAPTGATAAPPPRRRRATLPRLRSAARPRPRSAIETTSAPRPAARSAPSPRASTGSVRSPPHAPRPPRAPCASTCRRPSVQPFRRRHTRAIRPTSPPAASRAAAVLALHS